MNVRVKRELQNKARLAYCLVDILEYDVDNLKNDTNECKSEELLETLTEVKETLQNITDIIVEMEYALYLDKFKGA
jgi:hypothetical protein|nr:MAG TPA: hypothetical protein [Caudoviricetes sp.]